MSEQSEFLKELDIKEEDSVLEKPLTESTEEPEKETEDSEFKAKNRRERRLLAENQRLRDEAISASARAQALSEVSKFREELGKEDYIKEVRAIYGEDEPGKKMASDILESTLRKIEESATQKAFDKLQEQQGKESQAVKEEEKNLEDILDSVEDDHDIDMSDEAERKGFLTLLERISPKDKDGNIIEYADADATAELYLSRKERSSSRAKELSSRSMTRSGASQPSKIEEDATLRLLRENGII